MRQPDIKNVGISDIAKGSPERGEVTGDQSKDDVKNDAPEDDLEKYFVERTLPMRRGLGVQIDATVWQWLDNTYRGLKISKVELIEKALTQVLPDKFKP